MDRVARAARTEHAQDCAGNAVTRRVSSDQLIGTRRLDVLAKGVRNRLATTKSIEGTYGGILGCPLYRNSSASNTCSAKSIPFRSTNKTLYKSISCVIFGSDFRVNQPAAVPAEFYGRGAPRRSDWTPAGSRVDDRAYYRTGPLDARKMIMQG